MSTFRNSHGQWFSRSIAGCYAINNGDPQCADIDGEFDEAVAEAALDEAAERCFENRD